MRITLIHNPKAGDANHGKKQLMAALAKAGHHATYQSTKGSGFKKALKQPTDLVLAAGGDRTTAKVASRLVDSGIDQETFQRARDGASRCSLAPNAA